MGRTSDARERLIESAAALLHERGYTAVGVSEVCARAGVNKGSFYYFFPSKQELGKAVIDAYWQGYRPVLEALSNDGGSPVDRIRCFFASNVADHVERRANCGQMLGCPFGNLALEMSTQDDFLRELLRRYFEKIAVTLASVIDEAIEHGEMPPQDSARTARAMLALLQGELMMAKLDNTTDSLADFSDRVLLQARAAA